MMRLIITDDAFHGGEAAPDPRVVRIDSHAPPHGGELYTQIPSVTGRPHSEIRDEAAGLPGPLPGPAAIASRKLT